MIKEDKDFIKLLTAGDMLNKFNFQKEGYLPNNYRILPVKQLKDFCKQQGLTVSGLKKVLIGRLEQKDAECK